MWSIDSSTSAPSLRCIPRLSVVSPSPPSEGGEARGEEGREFRKASPLPNPLLVRRGEGEAACGLRLNQQLRDARPRLPLLISSFELAPIPLIIAPCNSFEIFMRPKRVVTVP